MGMTLIDFRTLVAAMAIDIYDDEITNHYLEVTGFPLDQDGDECDDEELCNARPCTMGEMASALVRLSNAFLLANMGHCDMSIEEQLIRVMKQHLPNVAIEATSSLSRPLRLPLKLLQSVGWSLATLKAPAWV